MLYFKNIRWKNFLSTGNQWTDIELDRSPSTVIVGENGAGKSTLLDAITYVLFNKPFRNITKLQLINTINEKDLCVEINFKNGNTEYLVRRGYKPNVFEIWKNGKLIDQPGTVKEYQQILEETILKLNYKSFTQIVVLGNASFTPFMQLSVRDRREVIEDLLDIQIFSSMNMLLKDRISENKHGILEVKRNAEITQEKIDIQKKYLKQIQTDFTSRLEQLKKDISGYQLDANSYDDMAKDTMDSINVLMEEISSESGYKKKSEKMSEILLKLRDKHSKAHKRVDFFEHNDNCPTCEQYIQLEIKTAKLSHTKDVIEETEGAIGKLTNELEEVQGNLERISWVQNNISDMQNEVKDYQSKVKFYNEQISKTEASIGLIKEEAAERNSETEDLQKLKSDLETYKSKGMELLEDKELFDIASKMLKDGGIKTKIIRQYVPIMNKLINKYLSALDFFVNFQLDEEFNEIIKSRHRDEFSYASFSEGEKMRIDLALLFTWRAIAKLKNSTNTNLLILDEVFDASLDTSGCDEFLKLLNEIGGETNVFVISHKGDVLTDKFRSQIRFEKHKNFSRVV